VFVAAFCTVFATACVVAIGCTRTARADDDAPAAARNRRAVPDVDHKSEGTNLTALPLFNLDPNTGVGLGVGGYVTMNGPRSSPLFAYTPYRQRIFLQAFATTGGYQQHIVQFDGLYIGGSPYRIRANAQFERNTNANYFGIGESTLGPLMFGGNAFSTFDAEQRAASLRTAAGVASPEYNHYTYTRPSADVSIERDLLGGWLRAQYGFSLQYVIINLYDGRGVVGQDAAGHDVHATEGPTKLGIDCAARAVIGCGGGFNDVLKLGIVLDTRDFEPDPSSGVVVDATGEWSSRGFGSQFNYLRLTLEARAFTPIVVRNLVLAARVLYSMQTTRVPFFAMNTLALTTGDQRGLGGETTIRGYRQDRFVAPVSALANVELRWTFVRFSLLSQQFSLQAAPLLDAGRVFDGVDWSFSRWRASAGAGLRVGWNRSTIIIFDAALSREDWGFFIDFDLPY
jgi:outer membrane protein assembly factor BamA